MSDLGLERVNFGLSAISPFHEMGAYEALWSSPKTTFKSLAEKFASHPGSIPSSFVPEDQAHEYAVSVKQKFEEAGIHNFGVRVHGGAEYPEKLQDAVYPVELLYYQGWWDLVESPSVAVVGTRHPTRKGCARARKLVKQLVQDEFTIVSGLATGIDRVAHTTAIEEGGRTIAVIGTPLSHFYPKDNAELQRYISKHFLVISQVPLQRYESQDYRYNRTFFPQRNVTMSALTEATIIVEASETSGTLFQARAALLQKRKLFILDSCFRNTRLTWPKKYAAKGAIRVKDYDDIRQHLSNTPHRD